MTYEQFMEWADEDTLAEWVDGKVEMSSPASLKHQQIGMFLGQALSTYATLHDLGLVLSPPFQMKLPRSGREPDLIFVGKANLHRLRDTRLDGPADLVVEIVSPESATRDAVTKLAEYQEAGIPEYWLIDPRSIGATFFQLDGDSRYVQVPINAHGIYHARTLPGFFLDTAWLWRDPLPSVEGTLLAIAGDDYARYLNDLLRREGLARE
jgi:Uma2 family endonuclease